MNRESEKKKISSGGKNDTKGRKLNLKRFVVFLIIFAAVAYFAYFIIWQQVSLSQKNREIEDLEKRITEATEQAEQLKQEIDNLNDPEYIEKVAREELGLVRPNERVFVDSNKSMDNAD